MPTILELFQNDQVLSNQVKPDKRTLVDVERSGIRIDSAADVNSPRLYGSDTIRITSRTTSMLDTMKTDRGTQGLGGLVGGTIAKAKQKANNLSAKLLGFPAPLNPSNVIAIGKSSGPFLPGLGFTPTPPYVFESAGTLNPAILALKLKAAFTGAPYGPGNEQDTMYNISKIKDKYGGTEIGKLLKSSLTGPPSEIGPKVVGGGIKLLKDKARDFLFGNGDLKTNDVRRDIDAHGSGTKQYSWIRGKVQDGTQRTDGPISAKDYKDQNARLEKVSPIYGVKRNGTPFKVGGQFGDTEYGFNAYSNDRVQKYSPVDENYSHFTQVNDRKDEKELDKEGTFAGKTLDERGLGHLKYRADGTVEPESRRAKNAFTVTPSDEPEWDSEKSTLKLGGSEYKDLVPFHITRIGMNKNIFKAYITGISETVSPSWSSNNFIGNPYKYYIYENIERSVTFTLNIAAENPQELARNWEKISHLTKAAYPLIPYQEDNKNISSNITSPPFIKFTLGDMYRERFGLIDSLSYTVPDNSVWETDIDGFVLPKFIEASITIKFAEDVASGNVDKLYDFKKDGTNFITNPIN